VDLGHTGDNCSFPSGAFVSKISPLSVRFTSHLCPRANELRATVVFSMSSQFITPFCRRTYLLLLQRLIVRAAPQVPNELLDKSP
jgi:hypothetical protein